jgi:hypothetical protein
MAAARQVIPTISRLRQNVLIELSGETAGMASRPIWHLSRVTTPWRVVVVLAAGISSVMGTSLSTWVSFHSDSGFTVQYPSSWFRKGISKRSLMIISSAGGAEGVIIKNGQGLISVVLRDNELTMLQLMDVYTRDAVVLARELVPRDGATKQECHELQKVVSKRGIVDQSAVPIPVPYVIDTDLFCEIGPRKFVIAVENFEGDPRQPIYQQTALRVAKSLHVDE